MATLGLLCPFVESSLSQVLTYSLERKMGCAAVKAISAKKNNHLIDKIAVHNSGVTCLTLSEDNSLLVTGTESGIAIMWSALSTSTELLGKLVGHESAVTCCLVYERFVVTGSVDTTIRKWSIESGMCLYIYDGHNSKVNNISCYSCFMFSTSYDKTAKAWIFCFQDTQQLQEDNKCLRTFRGHTKSVYPIVFVPSENKPLFSTQIFERDLLITGSADCSIKIWSFVSSDCLKTLLGHTSPVQCLQMEPFEKKQIFSAGGDGVIICWDIITGDMLRQLKGHHTAVLCLVAHKRMLYSGSVDRTARAWVMEFGECTRVYSGHSAAVACVQYHNGLVCTATCDGIAYLFDAKSGTMKRTFESHVNAITGLQVVSGKMFTTSSDGEMCVWSISGLKEETVFGSKQSKESNPNDDDCDAVKEAIHVIDYFVRK